MATVVSNDISWITGRSYDHIGQITRQRNNFYSYNNSNLRRMNLNNYNINNNDDDSSTSFSKKLINRRIEFVKPRNSDNARPSVEFIFDINQQANYLYLSNHSPSHPNILKHIQTTILKQTLHCINTDNINRLK